MGVTMYRSPWEKLEFVILSRPRGQSRAQTFVPTTSDGKVTKSKKTGRTVVIHHKSDAQKADEKRLAAQFMQYRPAAPLRGPILLGVKAYFQIPESVPECFKELAPPRRKMVWFRAAALSKELRPEKKPDFSNILKNLEDVMNGSFWLDDAQIVGVLPDSGKYYGDPPRYEVTVLYRVDRQ